MKKCLSFFIFCLFAVNIFAVQNGFRYININDSVSIELCYFSFYNDESDFVNSPNGLYWNLLVWAKNAENNLLNANVNIQIFVDQLENKILLMDGISLINYGEEYLNLSNEYFSYSDYDELIKNIFLILNTFYGINASYDNLDFVEVYIKNNNSNIARNIFGKIMDKYIFINKNELMNRNEYFIETITLTKENINDIIW